MCVCKVVIWSHNFKSVHINTHKNSPHTAYYVLLKIQPEQSMTKTVRSVAVKNIFSSPLWNLDFGKLTIKYC